MVLVSRVLKFLYRYPVRSLDVFRCLSCERTGRHFGGLAANVPAEVCEFLVDALESHFV